MWFFSADALDLGKGAGLDSIVGFKHYVEEEVADKVRWTARGSLELPTYNDRMGLDVCWDILLHPGARDPRENITLTMTLKMLDPFSWSSTTFKDGHRSGWLC